MLKWLLDPLSPTANHMTSRSHISLLEAAMPKFNQIPRLLLECTLVSCPRQIVILCPIYPVIYWETFIFNPTSPPSILVSPPAGHSPLDRCRLLRIELSGNSLDLAAEQHLLTSLHFFTSYTFIIHLLFPFNTEYHPEYHPLLKAIQIKGEN
jgi:hypothetical protein